MAPKYWVKNIQPQTNYGEIRSAGVKGRGSNHPVRGEVFAFVSVVGCRQRAGSARQTCQWQPSRSDAVVVGGKHRPCLPIRDEKTFSDPLRTRPSNIYRAGLAVRPRQLDAQPVITQTIRRSNAQYKMSDRRWTRAAVIMYVFDWPGPLTSLLTHLHNFSLAHSLSMNRGWSPSVAWRSGQHLWLWPSFIPPLGRHFVSVEVSILQLNGWLFRGRRSFN